MPRYKGQLVGEEDSSSIDEPVLHIFEYCNGPQNSRPTNRKEIVAMDACIYVNRRNLAKIGAEEVQNALQVGQEFDGYVIKCPNGPYDYAMKLWDIGRVAPLDNSGYPEEGEEVPALVIDRNGDYLTIACGSNIAYATKKSFLVSGVDPDDLSLPFGRLKVLLTKAETRPQEVPVAAWVATPTQVHPRKQD